MELTHFQKTVARALDLTDRSQIANIQRGWPQSEEDLEDILFQWRDTSATEIKGFELMSACSVVWQRRPADLSESQGRTVLYHPMYGSPIPEGAPLDGLSWEMLAFLRWAKEIGHFVWADEVIIAREIKESGGRIEALPGDRFYAKSMLPKSPTGEIDWSDLFLAKAKAFVLEGHIQESSSPKIEEIRLSENTLEGVLSSITSLDNMATRNTLLRGLPRGPIGAMSRSTAPGTDLSNIVRTVKGFGRLSNGRTAINMLIDNALSLVQGTGKAAELEQFRVQE